MTSMSATLTILPALERFLARLLHYGSWVASITIGVGLALAVIDPHLRIATAGIVLFILLPTVRVLSMLVFFIRKRDYRLAITAAVVLTIVALGFLLGLHTTSGTAG